MKKMIFNEATKRILSFVICLCMIVGTFAVSSLTVFADEGVDDNAEYVQVLRVVDDIKYGGKFTNDKLETVLVRADAVPEGAISDTKDLRDKFAASTIVCGDFITPAKLLDKKPTDAKEEEPEIPEVDAAALGYVVFTDYKREESEKGYGAVMNRVIAENPGRTIYIPDGDYTIEEPIVIPADPAKSVSLRFGNQAVFRADTQWADPNLAIIRVGVTERSENIPTMDELDFLNSRSISIIGGCIYGSNVASGISVEGGKDTYLYNVSIKATQRGIHIYEGYNELGATWVNVDNVNVTCNDATESAGVYVEGTYNTFSNMRIYIAKHGIHCTETGERNIFRNLHPLSSTWHGTESVGFYDMSDGNNYDICYSDQFATGYVVYENTRSVINGAFCYWYSEKNGYHVAFRSVGKFNSINVSGKMAHGHTIETDAYLLVEEEGGQGVVLYPIKSNKSDKYDDMLKQHCPTPIL